MLKDLKVTLDALNKIGAERPASLFEQLLRKEEERQKDNSLSTPIQTLSEEALKQQAKFEQLMHEIFTRPSSQNEEDNS